MMWKEYCKKKWIDPKDLESTVKDLRKQGKTIATLNGSFDLMHAGHLHMIFEASKVERMRCSLFLGSGGGGFVN